MVTKRTSMFQGLRLIGIMTIVAGHAGINLVGGGNWCTFFFILSGFLFSSEIRSWKDYRSYLFRKAKSLYPVYWLCLLLYLTLAFVRGNHEQSAIGVDFIPHFFLLQSWIPGIEPMAYLGPAWFLSSLLFCYVFSPVSSFLVRHSRFVILLIFLTIFLFSHFGIDCYVNPFYRFLEYCLGMWMRKKICNRPLSSEFFPGMMFAVIIIVLCLLHFGVSFYVNILLFAGLILCVYLVDSPVSRMLIGNKYIVQLSKADFFIYLTHSGIAFHLVFFFIGKNPVYLIIGSFVVGLILSEMYLYVNKKLLGVKLNNGSKNKNVLFY